MSRNLNFPPDLPITAKRAEIAAAIRQNSVIVVSGETGSGKSTQLPKICLEAGRGQSGLIGHTQPRRIAARSIATRIASELDVALGSLVGYRVRFDERLSGETLIKVMTDGMLLSELESDRSLRQYDTLIIDEAHERSLNIDFLLGYLRQFLPRHPDFRVVITSATLETEKFCRHFSNAPLIHVTGRSYPVEIRYCPVDEEAGDESVAIAIREAVEQLSLEGPGDMLVFLPGEREIREISEELRRHVGDEIELLPLYARLTASEQQRIFSPRSGQRIILATNVAETSLTIPGIRYVIDLGLARVSRYNPASKVQRLPVEAIAQDSADQRAGRCGRLSPGICVRLYSEADYAARAAHTDPEILRSSLAAVALRLAAMQLGRVERFPFIDPPESRQITAGYRLLRELDAIDRKDQLTAVGRELARLPVDPRLGRMLLAAGQRGCLAEVLVIAAVLEVNDPRVVPHDAQEKARAHHRAYPEAESDFLALLGIWIDYKVQVEALSRRQLRRWCEDRFLSPTRMREWDDLHRQLHKVMRERGHVVNARPADRDQIHKALLSGLLGNIARRDERGFYRGTRDRIVAIWPASRLARTKARWIMAAELTETTRLFARHVSKIEPEWIDEVASHQLRYDHSEAHWSTKRECVLAFESVSLWGLPVIARRPIDYATVEPQNARGVFIREGLARDLVRSSATFLSHNRALIATLREEEAKLRSPGSRVDEERVVAFFEMHLPCDISSTATLNSWYRTAPSLARNRLFLARDDVAGDVDFLNAKSFPDFLQVGESSLTLRYCCAPGTDRDGVSVEVPLYLINQLKPAETDRLIPGLLNDKILMLLKTLPKRFRRLLVPLPDMVETLLPIIKTHPGRLLEALAATTSEQTGIDITPQDFDANALPPHLHLHIELVDEQGGIQRVGNDVDALQRQFGSEGGKRFDTAIAGSIERRDIDEWDFGPLPLKVPGKIGSARVTAYPALAEASGGVAIRLCESLEEAAVCHRLGLHQLILHQLPVQRRLLRRIPEIDRLCLLFVTLGSCKALREDIVHAVLDRAFDCVPEKIRNAELFLELVQMGRSSVTPTVQKLTLEVGEILTQLTKTRSKLADAEQMAPNLVVEVKQQLERLVAPGFVCATPPEWLPELPRFLRAVALRIDKAMIDPEQDRMRCNRVEPFLARLHTLGSSTLCSPPVVDYRWLVEEYRVSVFAQELKTSRPVSSDRLEKQWQRAMRSDRTT